MSYHYQRMSDDRISDVKFLFKSVFNKNVSNEYLLKKYGTEYTGLKYVGFLAYENDKPVAMYGGLPQLFQQNGKLIKAVHACDSFTLPAHHRRGLHTNLALRSYEFMRENDVRFVYAMHSLNTLRATKKLGWVVGESMKRYHIRIKTLPVSKVANRMAALNRVYCSTVESALKKFETLSYMSNPLLAEGRLAQLYDQSYFDYKLFSFNRVIMIDNVKLWLKIKSAIHVGTFESPSVQDLKNAILQLTILCRKLGIHEIQFHVSVNSNQNMQLQSLYTGYESWTVGYLDLESGLDFDSFKLNYGDHDTF